MRRRLQEVVKNVPAEQPDERKVCGTQKKTGKSGTNFVKSWKPYTCFSAYYLMKTTILSFIRSLSRCILFLPRVAFPLILPSIISCLSTYPNHTFLHFPTVSNIVLVSYILCRTSSLLILSTQLIFSSLLQIHMFMAFTVSVCLSHCPLFLTCT